LAEKLENLPVVKWATRRHFVFDDGSSDGSHGVDGSHSNDGSHDDDGSHSDDGSHGDDDGGTPTN
jgi:hypothetical protein